MRAIGWAVLAAAALSPAIVRGASAQQAADEPREVRIGLLLNDLSAVNDAEQTFSADVFMLASWHDPDLAGQSTSPRTASFDEVWHPTLLIFNRRSITESLPRQVTVQPDGSVAYLQRFTGEFSSPLDLREFPRDRQEFFVWVVSPVRVSASVQLVPEDAIAAFRSDDLSISNWKIGEATLAPRTFQVAPGAPENPGIRLNIPAERRLAYYAIQVLIPLFAIVMMAYAVFWIAPTVVPTRVGVVVTTMLTLIAYRFMLANHVPRLSYLTRLDWFMLGATVLVILTLFTMAGTSFLVGRDREATVRKIDRVGRWLYPLAFVLYSMVVWWG